MAVGVMIAADQPVEHIPPVARERRFQRLIVGAAPFHLIEHRPVPFHATMPDPPLCSSARRHGFGR
jgi:hypothetical protein